MMSLLFYTIAIVLAIQDIRDILVAHANSDDSAVFLDNTPRRGTIQV